MQHEDIYQIKLKKYYIFFSLITILHISSRCIRIFAYRSLKSETAN